MQRPVATIRVACACHTLQLAVRDGLKTVPSSVVRATAKVASFVSSVKRSTLAAEVCVTMIYNADFDFQLTSEVTS